MITALAISKPTILMYYYPAYRYYQHTSVSSFMPFFYIVLYFTTPIASKAGLSYLNWKMFQTSLIGGLVIV